MGAILWGGVPSYNFNIQVERFPAQDGPQRVFESIQIPGRNGALTIDTGAFSNYSQLYEIYFSANKKKTPTIAREVKKWLQLPIGYQRLEDTYEPEVFRLARYNGPSQIENTRNLFGRMTLTFDCQPQRWLKSGEYPVKFTQSGKLSNEWFPALPLIQVNGNGPGNLYIGEFTVQIKALEGYLIIDSAIQNAYKDTQNKNGDISTTDFPVLQPGITPVSWDGGISSLEITPRWWTL